MKSTRSERKQAVSPKMENERKGIKLESNYNLLSPEDASVIHCM